MTPKYLDDLLRKYEDSAEYHLGKHMLRQLV